MYDVAVIVVCDDEKKVIPSRGRTRFVLMRTLYNFKFPKVGDLRYCTPRWCMMYDYDRAGGPCDRIVNMR